MNASRKSPVEPVAAPLDQEEAVLLAALAAQPDQRLPILHALRRLYQRAGQPAKADSCVAELLAADPKPENKARYAVALGGAAEMAGNYAAAVRHYELALSFVPKDELTAYFANNNLGFSLNQLGRFTEGESFCRVALQLDPRRPNAHKNLGLALAGQQRWREAAANYIEGSRVAPHDGRACELLNQLLRDHPELNAEFGEAAKAVRLAVSAACQWKN